MGTVAIDEERVEALRAGASGYLLKDSDPKQILNGIEAVAAGRFFLDSVLPVEALIQLEEKPDKHVNGQPSGHRLTPRELEIIQLIAQGLSSKEIAEKLFISQKTVENHRANIMAKLKIRRSVDLVRRAAQLGLIDLEIWKG